MGNCLWFHWKPPTWENCCLNSFFKDWEAQSVKNQLWVFVAKASWHCAFNKTKCGSFTSAHIVYTPATPSFFPVGESDRQLFLIWLHGFFPLLCYCHKLKPHTESVHCSFFLGRTFKTIHQNLNRYLIFDFSFLIDEASDWMRWFERLLALLFVRKIHVFVHLIKHK